MSRWMQIRVRVEPFYRRSLARDLPRLARALAEVDYDLIESNPALSVLIEHLGPLTDNPALDPAAKGAIAARAEELFTLRRALDDRLGEWKLAEADRILYRIEDIFSEMDQGLS